MASKSYVSFCKYFFYKGDTLSPAKRLSLVQLAYQTARNKDLHPKEILIRSDLHDSTTINGKRQKDPSGWHGTFAFKNDEHVNSSTHIAIHGYTSGKDTFELKKASATEEKADTTKRAKGKPVWPSSSDLEQWADVSIAYGHESSTDAKARERSKTPDASKVREKSKTPDASKAREGSKTPEASKARERSKTPDASKVREKSKTPEASKVRETSKSKTPETTKPKKKSGKP